MCGHAEGIATWYLRLNGYLTTTNFVLHPETGSVQLTDVDVVAVRLPWRRETAGGELIDDEWVGSHGEVTSVVIAEVKKAGPCRLNGPTRDPERRNLQRVLSALGAFRPEQVDDVATLLYSRGGWHNEHHRALLCCFGDDINRQLSRDLPDCQQLTWSNVSRFIHRRFTAHMDQKKQHQQWDDLGQWLWNWATAMSASDFERKVSQVL
jgi:hypothetical protein